MQKKWQLFFMVFVVLVVVWSIFLRFYKLGSIPTGLYWDETAILVDAKSISQTGLDMHGLPWYHVIFPSYGDYKLPVYIWLASVSVKILGASEFSLRLPSAIAGLLTIFSSGYLIKLLLETEGVQVWRANLVGLSSALALALSPWSIVFSRTGFEAHVGQLFLSISILFLLQSKKNKFLLFLSPILGLIATYSYFSVRFVWLGVFVVVATLYFIVPSLISFSTKKWKSFLVEVSFNFFIPLIIFGIGLLPMLKSPLYKASNTFRLSTDSVLQNSSDVIQSNVYREEAGNTRIDRVIFYRWWLTARKLFSNYADNVSLNFLFFNGDQNLRHGTTQHGLFLFIFLPFFLIGWFILFQRYRRICIVFFCWWMLALLPASVPNTVPHALRSLNALVPLSCVIGIGLEVFLEKLLTLKGNLGAGFILLLLLIIFSTLLQFSYFYFEVYPSISSTSWQGGFKELTQKIFSMRSSNEQVYVLNFDDRFYLWILAYGPYFANQIQDFPHNNFQLRRFDGISTDEEPQATLKDYILVGPQDQVNFQTKKIGYSVTNNFIFHRTEKEVFEVAKISPGKK